MVGVVATLAGAATKYSGAATVTVGRDTSFDTIYGYFSSGGTITPATWAATGYTFNNLYWISFNGGSPAPQVLFSVASGVPIGNSGWSRMFIDGNAFLRSDAVFSSSSSGTSWRWSNIASNPFGTVVGAEKLVTWT